MKILGWLGFILVFVFGIKITLFSPNFNFDFSNPCFFCEVKQETKTETKVETKPAQISDYEQKRLAEMEKRREQIRDHGCIKADFETEANKQKITKDISREKGHIIIQNGQPISEKCN